MSCPIGGKITFAPHIKSWEQALSLAASGYITDILEGMTKGALVGVGGAAIGGLGSVASVFSGSASAIAGNVGRVALQGLGRIGTNLAQGFFLDAGSKSVEATANVLQKYGETGNWNVAGDFATGYWDASVEDYNALRNIVTNGGSAADWEAAIMLLAPGGGSNNNNSNIGNGNNSNTDGGNGDGSSSESSTDEADSNNENDTSKNVVAPENPNSPTTKKGEAFEDPNTDPPGTWRDKNGRLHDEKTGRFVVDPKVGRKKAIDFYKKHNPKMTERQIRSHISGIDFTKPVKVVKVPEGTNLTQYTKVNTEGTKLRGDYYTKDPNATPNDLGVSDKYNVQTPERIPTQEVKDVTKETISIPKDMEGLESTSAEINDTWSRVDEYGNELPVHTDGGGSQIYIPKTQF